MKRKILKSTVPALHVDEGVSLEEQIAQRAHELWHQRGREHGPDMADWFRAESPSNVRLAWDTTNVLSNGWHITLFGAQSIRYAIESSTDLHWKAPRMAGERETLCCATRQSRLIQMGEEVRQLPCP